MIQRQERLVVEGLRAPGVNFPQPGRAELQPAWVRFKNLHAVVPGVGDKNLTIRTDLDPDRFIQVAGFQPQTAELGQIGAICVEDNHALFAGVGHEDAPGLVDGDPTGTPEAIWQAINLKTAPHPQELPIRREDLDAMVPCVRDINIPVHANRDTPGLVHQPSGDVSIHYVAVTAKGIQEQALRVEVHNAMVARVRDEQTAICSRGDIPGGIEGCFTRKIDHAQGFEADSIAGVGVHARLFGLRADAVFPDHCGNIFFDVHARVIAGRPAGEGQRRVVEGDRVLRVVAVEPNLPDSRSLGWIFPIPKDARQAPITIKGLVWPPHPFVFIAVIVIAHDWFYLGKIRSANHDDGGFLQRLGDVRVKINLVGVVAHVPPIGVADVVVVGDFNGFVTIEPFRDGFDLLDGVLHVAGGMGVNQQLHGIVIIDVGRAIGCAGGLQAEQTKESQQSCSPEVCPSPIFQQGEQTGASAQGADQCKQEFTRRLKLE